MDMHAVLDRIDSIAASRNLTDRKLSLMAGMSGDVIRNWRRRLREEGGDVGASSRSIAAVAHALGVSPEWLETGHGDAAGGITREAPTPTPDHWRRIKCYDIDAAAGDGCLVGIENAMFDIGFSTAMLRDITMAPPESLAFVRVRGESMVPTLLNGDWILVDTTRRAVGLGGLFLLRSDDMLMVKRVLPIEGGRIRVQSDNPAVPPFDTDPGVIEIMGRIVWFGRRV